MKTYKCNRCLLDKPKIDFPKNKAYTDGIKKTCKICTAKRQKEYWLANPDQYEKQKQRVKVYDLTRNARFKRYNLTVEEYQQMYDRFDGKCWSCKDREAIHIDHDHLCCGKLQSCGKCVRGLLCSQCNTALGLLQDSTKKVSALLKYITDASSNG